LLGGNTRQQAFAELRGTREVALFARVSVFAACVPLLMRLPLPRVAALLSRADKGSRPADHASAARIPSILGLAHRAFRPLVRSGCLTRGVTLFWFLRRAGVDVVLCFGLDASDGEPGGHCWLVHDGEPYLESRDPRPRFAETYRLPA
jgi:hypothetical protein